MHTYPAESYRLSAIRGTPYPNRLLDHSVTLPETQVRILNLVVRLTLGWHAGSPGERRSTVTATLSQIKRRVGRSSLVPVAEALAALARSGVVEVREADGGPLEIGDLVRNRRRPLMLSVARQWVEEA